MEEANAGITQFYLNNPIMHTNQDESNSGIKLKHAHKHYNTKITQW